MILKTTTHIRAHTHKHTKSFTPYPLIQVLDSATEAFYVILQVYNLMKHVIMILPLNISFQMYPATRNRVLHP